MTEPSLPRHGPSSEASLAREEPNSHVDDPSAGAQRLLEDTDSSGKKAVSENIEGKVENKQKRKRTRYGTPLFSIASLCERRYDLVIISLRGPKLDTNDRIVPMIRQSLRPSIRGTPSQTR